MLAREERLINDCEGRKMWKWQRTKGKNAHAVKLILGRQGLQGACQA